MIIPIEMSSRVPNSMAINHNCMRLCLQRPLIVIVLLALVTCSILILLQNINMADDSEESIHSPALSRRFITEGEIRSKDELTAKTKSSVSQPDVQNMLLRIEDLRRIKASVSNELRLLQREKMKVLRDRANLLSKSEKISLQISKSKHLLSQLELDISANKKQKTERLCNDVDFAPIIFNPMISIDISNYSIPADLNQNRNLVMPTISTPIYIDFNRCSLTKEFKFNLIDYTRNDLATWNDSINDYFKQSLQTHSQYLAEPDTSVCLTVILLRNLDNKRTKFATTNNLVINLSQDQFIEESDPREQVSMIASSIFKAGTYRDNIDLVIPSIFQAPNTYESIVGSIPLQSPLSRKYFASYFGETSDQPMGDDLELQNILQTIHRSSIDDMFLFIYNCGPSTNQQCYDEREKMIELSTFLIVIPNEQYTLDRNSNDLIYLALSRGAIPVIVGKERIRLPFDEVLDWRLASILVPTARLPEIHFILRSLSPGDLYSLKYHGRRIFENHLATSKQIVNTILSIVSLERLNYPPPAIEDIKTDTYFKEGELNIDKNHTLSACQDTDQLNTSPCETLGPREIPFGSPTYRRNFSLAFSHSYNLWNNPLHSPFHLTPSLPNDPIPPSEFKFITSNQAYRPLGNGQGGSGFEFSQALGGDYPNEQFTIVILTYERIALLLKTLERLKGMAYLNKILVIWNGVNQRPHESLVWPDVGVPIVLVKVEKNSLNNRFLPYDAIETDAIFSMDDDSPLRPDEIVFAFRVWRQSRDRIVGFPGRFHAWDNAQSSWMYNSNHSCELSMVLTGGAFFHRYYTYAYTQLMPEAIRSIVDKFMNCEDVAMNFLVAHLTRKPPIKVTSRWTFHCATCATSLSEDDTHFMERHECLNIFTAIYGYMPLLNTQHRSDSILFKTRLPRDKQKCFKFV